MPYKQSNSNKDVILLFVKPEGGLDHDIRGFNLELKHDIHGLDHNAHGLDYQVLVRHRVHVHKD